MIFKYFMLLISLKLIQFMDSICHGYLWLATKTWCVFWPTTWYFLSNSPQYSDGSSIYPHMESLVCIYLSKCCAQLLVPVVRVGPVGTEYSV